MIHTGDCLDILPTLDAESFDAIVTDPPYGLEFMGKAWDKLVGDLPNAAAWEGRRGTKRIERRGTPCKCVTPDWEMVYPPGAPSGAIAMQRWHEAWAREAFRVAKPSAYLLAFGGTRTVHRLACAIEDAGWIIRDTLVWAYASGFPKSRASLKPAWEPIVMARKPGPLRMLAIDECRIGTTVETWPASRSYAPGQIQPGGVGETQATGPVPAGRWPANVILTDPIFDGDVPGVVGGGETAIAPPYRITDDHIAAAAFPVSGNGPTYGDSGTYSRFFLIPKADRADREPVLGGLPERVVNITEGHGLGPVNTSKGDGTGIRENRARANVHPTVKPTELMRHLVRLVTPTGGVVLDPFLGSGTTALAAEMEGFAWVGIEREPEYVAIAEARLNGTQRGLGLGA